MFTATATAIADTLRHEVHVNGRHELVTDEPERLGGTDTGPAPHELLPAMLASCVSTTMIMYARRHGWSLDGLSVDVTYDSDTTPRRVTTTIHLPGHLNHEQVQRLEKVAANCPVKRAFEAGFDFTAQLVVAPSPSAAMAA